MNFWRGRSRTQLWTTSVVLIASLALTFNWKLMDTRIPQDRKSILTVEYVPGYFEHETQMTGPEAGFRATTLPAFGLIDQPYPTDAVFDPDRMKSKWERFVHFLTELNTNNDGVFYKLLFVARHGDGWHNVKEAAVGRHDWESHWARETGDGTIEWVDALLTPAGEQDAVAARQSWEKFTKSDNVPMPQRFFTSPLRRCIQTANLTFGPLLDPPVDRPWLTVTEGLREIHGRHTCDRHGSRGEIIARFPFVDFENEFPESDNVWQADQRESLDAACQRIHAWLQRLFETEEAIFISTSTHAGAIRALYRAVGHPDVWSARGAVSPLLIRAQIRNDTAY